MKVPSSKKRLLSAVLCSSLVATNVVALRPQPSIFEGVRDIGYQAVVNAAVDAGQYAIGEAVVRTGEGLARRLGISEETLERLEAGAAIVAACVIGACMRRAEPNRFGATRAAVHNAAHQGAYGQRAYVNPAVFATAEHPHGGYHNPGHQQYAAYGHGHHGYHGPRGHRGCRRW